MGRTEKTPPFLQQLTKTSRSSRSSFLELVKKPSSTATADSSPNLSRHSPDHQYSERASNPLQSKPAIRKRFSLSRSWNELKMNRHERLSANAAVRNSQDQRPRHSNEGRQTKRSSSSNSTTCSSPSERLSEPVGTFRWKKSESSPAEMLPEAFERKSTSQAQVEENPVLNQPNELFLLHIHSIVPKSEWVSDRERSSCRECERPFRVWRTRHHCRACGEVFCEKCSSQTLIFRNESVRACDACVQKIQEEKEKENYKLLEKWNDMNNRVHGASELEEKQTAVALVESNSYFFHLNWKTSVLVFLILLILVQSLRVSGLQLTL